MVECKLNSRDVSRSILLVVTILLLICSTSSAEAFAYYSLTEESETIVSSPPVIFQDGTVGTSTIYTNNTSARIIVVAPRTNDTEDFVDNNISDIDNSTDKGTHSNFTAQQYYDSYFDTLTEANTSSPTTYQTHPSDFDDLINEWNNEPNAWDWNNATSATAPKGKIESDIYWYTWNNTDQGTISQVDLRVRLDLTGLIDDLMTISWYVGATQGVGTYEINSTNQGTDIVVSFDDVTEPTNGTWEWADIGNLEIRQVGTKVGGPDTLTYAVDEIWGWISASKPNYELDLEVQWTNVDFDEPNEELCIYCGTMGSENITVDAWNGTEWNNLLADLSSGWNNVSVSSYLTSSNFTIRFKGGNETSDATQDSWNIDATLLYIFTSVETTYDYVLRVNNTVTDSWEIRLKKYSDSNINRLQNCTIYFHNSTDGTSGQIYIENGTYTQDAGPWYNLSSLETIYIAMTVEANSTGTSSIYAYLEICIPDTTTYAQYMVTFEIK